MAARRHVTPLVVTTTGYEPTDPEGQAYHAKLKLGSVVGAEIARSRSLPQQRRYWSILAKVVELAPSGVSGREWRTPETLHAALKCATGYIEIVQLIDGRMVKIPESTRFDQMGHEAFCDFMTAATKIIEDEILGGEMSCDELLAETSRPETNAAARIMRNGDYGG